MKPSTPMLADTTRPLPHDDAVAVAPLLDTASVQSILSEHAASGGVSINSCRIAHIRYKPSRGCTVLYSVEFTDSDTGVKDDTFVYARSFPTRKYERAVTAGADRDWAAGKLFGSYIVDDRNHAILYDFPNDAALPWLRLVPEPSRLANMIAARSGLQVSVQSPGDGTQLIRGLRYKPESRLVARMDLVAEADSDEMQQVLPIILRFSRSDHPVERYAILQRLHSAFCTHDKIGVPEPIVHLVDWNIIVQKYAAGRKLSQVMKTDDAAYAVGCAAEGLAKLHGYRDDNLPRFDMSDHLERARQEVGWLKSAGKEVERQSGRILHWMLSSAGSCASDDVGFVHGDFHQGQVLCDHDRIWLVDFDRSHMGATTADVGNFLAQHKLLQLRGRLPSDSNLDRLFLEQYARAIGFEPDRAGVKFWMVTGLLELATKEFRRLKVDWPHRVQQILTECQATIDG